METYHILDFTCICVHPAGGLSSLDVAPDHGGHVSLIIHEASVKVRAFIGIGGFDVSETSREGILQKVEHGKEFTSGPATLLVLKRMDCISAVVNRRCCQHLHQHVVTLCFVRLVASKYLMGETYIPTSNDTVVHDWLVGLVLEIALPPILEVGSRPGLKLPQFLSSRAHLDTGFDTIGCKRTGSLLVPLVKDLWYGVSGWGWRSLGVSHTLLDDRVSTNKVVETLGLWLGSIHREVKVVVLEVLA